MSITRKLAAAALTTLVGGGALIGLAPGAGAATVGIAGYDVDFDWCGTKVPWRFPPPPPPDNPWDLDIVLDHGELVSPVLGGLVDVQTDLGAGHLAGGQFEIGALGFGG